MSGGVDSVVAGIMKEEKYNVIGVTLKLYDDAKKVALEADNVVLDKIFLTPREYPKN